MSRLGYAIGSQEFRVVRKFCFILFVAIMPGSQSKVFSLASEVLSAITRCSNLEQYREIALQALYSAIEAEKIVWVYQQDTQWSVVGSPTALAHLPIDLVASAAEELQVIRSDGWLAAPITGHNLPAEVLLVSPHQCLSVDQAESVVQMLRSGQQVASQRIYLNSRVEQLGALIELSRQWQQNQDLAELLNSVAVAASRVLQGDRSTIFLWDKPRRELVGYPALGVEGKRLRVRDDQGIAGEVFRTGLPKRWDESQGTSSINTLVGKQLGYVARSLVAAPLLDRRNKPLGVFEVLNHRLGQFSQEDQDFLIELARFASLAVENLQQISQLMQSRDRLVEWAQEAASLEGHCHQILSLRETVKRVASTDLAVLILGENGTGKEVVARSLHLQSDRRSEPFVAVNCAAIVESLIESELFGHTKGAFTDAVSDRAGKFELAAGGTLFLDEIGDLSLGGQAKLLRVLEDKLITRVGSQQTIHTDVRVLAATNQDLARLVRDKRFREDLYYRLNVVTLQLPPLREREQDVIELANHFLRQFAQQIGRLPPTLSESAEKRLKMHSWPGNVRELRNLMERVSYLTHGTLIEETDLAFVIAPGSSSDVGTVPANMSLSDATDVFQRQYIQRHVDSASGNLAQAAKQLGMHRSNLYRKMTQLGVQARSQ